MLNGGSTIPMSAGASLDARGPYWEERRRQKMMNMWICVVRLEDTTPPVHEAIDGGLTGIHGQIKCEIHCPSALPDMAKNVIMRRTHQYLSRCEILSE
jgi:hypothetical protein